MHRVLQYGLVGLVLVVGAVSYMRESSRATASITTDRDPRDCQEMDELLRPTVGKDGFILVRDGKMQGFIDAYDLGAAKVAFCNPFWK